MRYELSVKIGAGFRNSSLKPHLDHVKNESESKTPAAAAAVRYNRSGLGLRGNHCSSTIISSDTFKHNSPISHRSKAADFHDQQNVDVSGVYTAE